MAAITTAGLTISWGGTVVTGIGTATVTTTQSMVETTDITSATQTFFTGNRTSTASVEMFYDQGVAAMASIETAANTGAASATLLITLASGMTYSGAAFVTSFQATGGINDVLRASIEFQYTGVVTIA